MSKAFSIKSENLIDLTLSLQKINDVALPIALQFSLNQVARDAKTKYLAKTTGQMFDIKRRNFFKANSGYKTHKAKEFNYNVNRLKAEVGITKGRDAREKATEQVGSQQTAKDIKRSINPLGTKPQTKAVIDLLSKKPEVYDFAEHGGFKPEVYFRKVGRAKKRNAPFLRKNSNRGTLHRVKSMKRFKAGKRKGRINIKLQPIASYIKGGHVKLMKKKPFLNEAAFKSMVDIMEKTFRKEAQIQVERAMKRKR